MARDNKTFNNPYVSVSISGGAQSTICDPIAGMPEEKPFKGFEAPKPRKKAVKKLTVKKTNG